MAQNTTNEYRKFRYYEGVCSSSDFIKELAQVVSLGVKSDAIKTVDGKVLQESKPLKAKNWDIVYPMVDKNFSEYSKLNTRDKYLDPENGVDSLSAEQRVEKLKNQINQITDMVILRTKTSPKNIAEDDIDDLSVSQESDLASTTMYVQFYKPKYLANPEEYPLDAELHGLTPQLITKEMYQEARKSKKYVTYDLTLLDDPHNVKAEQNIGIIGKEKQPEQVDSASNGISLDSLFGENGILLGLTTIKGLAPTEIESVIERPTSSNRVTECTVTKEDLTSIKQLEPELYNFIFGICGLKTTFTEADYNNIQTMKISVTLSGTTESEQICYVHLFYEKIVTVYYINYTLNESSGKMSAVLDTVAEYGSEALEKIRPEIYSEGRYIPLPSKYLGTPDNKQVVFEGEPLKFCLDKVVDDSILYGTLVLRYEYSKNLKYTDVNSLEITDSITLPNNHYCLVRMFDNPSNDFSGPEPNIQDAQGNVTTTNSHTSPWSKLSWYQDFEEIMMDHIDEDLGVTSVTDGTLLVPLVTPGLTADTKLSYWVNTNNDRFSLVVMGNPALDYERDRHLIANCYIGRIESFENSVNDVSGNFALYTSSSTTPCKTTMDTNTTQYHINRKFENKYFVEGTGYKLKDADEEKFEKAIDRFSNIEAYQKYCKEIGGYSKWSKISRLGFALFYINITGNKFFNEDECPRYMIINPNTGNPVPLNNDPENPVYYKPVANYMPVYGANDSRTNLLAIYVNPLDGVDGYDVYFNFGYHEEKFVITSGITRDAFGNVVDIETIDEYGKNTSDGVTSVSMYHTRSKAFYQKHHFLFATTEEYMSKVMYGKSSYTGEYYADRIKITHGNDGPRGILSDVLVIDSSSLYPKDELVINKDFEKQPNDLEETFTYFPVTAPFSPLSDGPNARYGIAIKKSEREPNYTSNDKLIAIASDELRTLMVNDQILENKSIVLPQQTSNGCTIYWSVDHDANWMEYESGELITKKFADEEEKTFVGIKYEADNIQIVVDGFKAPTGGSNAVPTIFEISQGQKKTKDFLSQIHLKTEGSFDSGAATEVLYSYSDDAIDSMKVGTVLTSIIDDGTSIDNVHEYAFEEYPVDLVHKANINTIKDDANGFEKQIFNAHPSKHLNMYFVKNGSTKIATLHDSKTESDVDVFEKEIIGYATINLGGSKEDEDATLAKSFFSLLQYPCTVSAYTSGITNNNEQGILVNSSLYSKYMFVYNPYGEQFKIYTKNMNGKVGVIRSNYLTPQELTNSNGIITIESNKMYDDIYLSINK